MGHDATKVLMGAVKSTFRSVDNFVGNVVAGLGCRLKSDNSLSTAKADGELVGVSIGGNLAGTNRTAVCRRGDWVPMKLATSQTPVIGAQVFIDDTTGEAKTTNSSATGVNATFQSVKLVGIQEDKSLIDVAYIAYEGGL